MFDVSLPKVPATVLAHEDDIPTFHLNELEFEIARESKAIDDAMDAADQLYRISSIRDLESIDPNFISLAVESTTWVKTDVVTVESLGKWADSVWGAIRGALLKTYSKVDELIDAVKSEIKKLLVSVRKMYNNFKQTTKLPTPNATIKLTSEISTFEVNGKFKPNFKEMAKGVDVSSSLLTSLTSNRPKSLTLMMDTLEAMSESFDINSKNNSFPKLITAMNKALFDLRTSARFDRSMGKTASGIVEVSTIALPTNIDFKLYTSPKGTAISEAELEQQFSDYDKVVEGFKVMADGSTTFRVVKSKGTGDLNELVIKQPTADDLMELLESTLNAVKLIEEYQSDLRDKHVKQRDSIMKHMDKIQDAYEKADDVDLTAKNNYKTLCRLVSSYSGTTSKSAAAITKAIVLQARATISICKKATKNYVAE